MILAFVPACAADRPRDAQVLIYYANETSQQAARSANYAAVLSVLDGISGPTAAALSRNIRVDASEFPQVVRRDADALLAAARRFDFDLVVFTNEAALADEFRVYRGSTGALDVRPLPALPAATSTVLATSPLSRPEFLRAALHAVADLYGRKPVDAVLIVNSHGSEDMLLMPRVNADLSFPGAAEALARQLDTDGDDAALAPWAGLKGTDKLTFWRSVSEVSAATGMRFPLVFLESCESGTASFAQWRAISDDVELIAHTGTGNIRPVDIDYGKFFAAGPVDADWVADLISGLTASGVHVDGKSMQPYWILWFALEVPAAWVYFIPLGLWLCWSAFAGLARLRMASAS